MSSDAIYRRYVVKTYGITLEELDTLYEEQEHSCKLCGVHVSELEGKKTKLCVDHCHTTGKVRGLLCAKCNSVLGLANDSPAILQKAIDYLKDHSNE